MVVIWLESLQSSFRLSEATIDRHIFNTGAKSELTDSTCCYCWWLPWLANQHIKWPGTFFCSPVLFSASFLLIHMVIWVLSPPFWTRLGKPYLMPPNVGSRECQYSVCLSYSCRDNNFWKSIHLSPILLVQRISTLNMVIHMYLRAATVSQGPRQACGTSERTWSCTYSGCFPDKFKTSFFLCTINPSSISSTILNTPIKYGLEKTEWANDNKHSSGPHGIVVS